MDGKSGGLFFDGTVTGIWTSAESFFIGFGLGLDVPPPGNAGKVDVTVNGRLKMINGASISSSVLTEDDYYSNADEVIIKAGELQIQHDPRELSEDEAVLCVFFDCDNPLFSVKTGLFSQIGGNGKTGSITIDVRGGMNMLGGWISIKSDIIDRDWKRPYMEKEEMSRRCVREGCTSYYIHGYKIREYRATNPNVSNREVV